MPPAQLPGLNFDLGDTIDSLRDAVQDFCAHEITPREPHNGYLILQGGLPEVDAFVQRHWK